MTAPKRGPGNTRGPLPSLPDRRRWTIYLPGELARRAEEAAGGRGQIGAWVRGLIEREVNRPRPRLFAGANCGRCYHCLAVHSEDGCLHCGCAGWSDD